MEGSSPNQYEKILHDAFAETDLQIVAECGPSKDRSGSTAAVAIVSGSKEDRWLHAANVGDARIILGRNGVATRLTYDHKANDPVEKKRITDMGGLVFMNKVAGTLAVSRAFGDAELKPWVIVEPYITRTQLTSDCKFLVVACDGLFDVASDQEVIDFVINESSLTAQEIAEKLVKFALERRTKDNLSIIVVKL